MVSLIRLKPCVSSARAEPVEQIAQTVAIPASSPEPLSSLEVAAPVQVERVSVRFHFDVAPDGDFGWVHQPNLAILAQRIEKVKLAAFAVDECGKSIFALPKRRFRWTDGPFESGARTVARI